MRCCKHILFDCVYSRLIEREKRVRERESSRGRAGSFDCSHVLHMYVHKTAAKPQLRIIRFTLLVGVGGVVVVIVWMRCRVTYRALTVHSITAEVYNMLYFILNFGTEKT